ncbi:Transposase InsO and inactivated derivatives [Jiangella alkaliphila]|uniref:Transposase InsO and inactivated derivatives n=1 Tax=Jiangella alkaliphila TaxID=419479 RepID=A0A1H2LEM9_9ACTN|nr:Transposase InsO and inactivated derivatives [Jiangella alkaliphila]
MPGVGGVAVVVLQVARPATHTPRQQRRDELDAAVKKAFTESRELHGSPRIHADLREAGWTVGEKTVADSMKRQSLVARAKKRRKNTTRPDKRAIPFADLVNRDFTAEAPNCRWVGDMTEIPTDEGKLYLSTAIDLFSRRLLGYATSPHPDAVLAADTIKMAVAARGGVVAGVVFHTDRGSTYTAHDFTELCRDLKITQSMGRVGSCFDNAAAESFFSTLEHEVLSRHHFTTRDEAKRVIIDWVVDFYNCRRRHSSCGMKSPIDYENSAMLEAA